MALNAIRRYWTDEWVMIASNATGGRVSRVVGRAILGGRVRWPTCKRSDYRRWRPFRSNSIPGRVPVQVVPLLISWLQTKGINQITYFARTTLALHLIIQRRFVDAFYFYFFIFEHIFVLERGANYVIVISLLKRYKDHYAMLCELKRPFKFLRTGQRAFRVSFCVQFCFKFCTVIQEADRVLERRLE